MKNTLHKIIFLAIIDTMGWYFLRFQFIDAIIFFYLGTLILFQLKNNTSLLFIASFLTFFLTSFFGDSIDPNQFDRLSNYQWAFLGVGIFLGFLQYLETERGKNQKQKWLGIILEHLDKLQLLDTKKNILFTKKRTIFFGIISLVILLLFSWEIFHKIFSLILLGFLFFKIPSKYIIIPGLIFLVFIPFLATKEFLLSPESVDIAGAYIYFILLTGVIQKILEYPLEISETKDSDI